VPSVDLTLHWDWVIRTTRKLFSRGGREHRHPVIVLVPNNPYALDRPLVRGTRPALGSGQLGVLVLDAARDSPCAPGRV